MRFLCLHGMGTNGKIFEMQTSRIRHSLGDTHQYVFVEGSIPVKAAPGIQKLALPGDQFLRFTRGSNDTTAAKTLFEDLSYFIETEGPFDGIMGFSEGAAVAASLLVEHERLTKGGLRSPFNFIFGVFFSAMDPYDMEALASKCVLRKLDPSTDGCILSLPTAHIWSEVDTLYPGAGGTVRDLADEALREDFVHDLGHSVPGTISEEGVHGAVKAIRRTLERAKGSRSSRRLQNECF